MKKFSFKKLVTSFGYAFAGLGAGFVREQNFFVMVIIAAIVVVLMFVFGLSPIEKSIIIVMIAMVLSLELVNSSVEKALNHLHPERDPSIKRAKDFLAGSVLLAAIAAVVVGLIIFWPYFVS
jgi:diacylglycerol kinase